MDYTNINWTPEAYAAFLADLKVLADPKYKAFHENLCKTSKAEILGVRSPDTKRIAKAIAKGADAEGFLALCGDTFYEELLIKGLVLAFWKRPLAEKRVWIDRFVPQIDNWAVCDSFCAALKPKKCEYETLFSLCLDYLQKAGEYERRFAIVLMMDYLLEDEYIDRVFNLLPAVDCNCYYVHMAVAWCISFCFIRYKEKTLAFLKAGVLDTATHNKSIQKIIESNRVCAEDKLLVRSLKQ